MSNYSDGDETHAFANDAIRWGTRRYAGSPACHVWAPEPNKARKQIMRL